MPPIEHIIILFFVGLLAGFINVMAGGGSTLTLPALIFLGLDTTTANGTNRVAILIQNIAAVTAFKKEKHSKFRLSLKMALCTLPGAIAGAIIAAKIDDETFKIILGVIMIAVAVSMLIPKKKITETIENPDKLKPSVYLAMVGIGFYGGFIQVGVGFLLMAALHYLIHINLVHVNMHKVFIILIYTAPALLVFTITGNVNYGLGLAMAAGNALGGWQAAKLAVRKGEKIVKIVLIAGIFVISLKLFGVFG